MSQPTRKTCMQTCEDILQPLWKMNCYQRVTRTQVGGNRIVGAYQLIKQPDSANRFANDKKEENSFVGDSLQCHGHNLPE